MTIHLAPSWILTDERVESSYGIPVLVNRANNTIAYGPADIVPGPVGKFQPAAMLVHRLAKFVQDEQQRASIASFLHQWPDGPQL